MRWRRAGEPFARRSRSGTDEHGSALLLFPVAMVIVLFLAALTFDASLAFLAKREAVTAANAAANDAAVGIARASYLGNGSYELDAAAAQQLAEQAVAQRATSAYLQLSAPAAAVHGTEVEVSLDGAVDLPFHAFIGPRTLTFTVVGHADARHR